MSNQPASGEGRRQRSTSDEFEPLNSRQDVMGPDGGRFVCGRLRRWLRCCWTVEALFVLLGVLMLVYLSAINTGIRLPGGGNEGSELEELESSLDAFKTDFFTLYTTGLSSELILMEFPIDVVAGSTAIPIMFGASYAKGTYDDDSSTVSLLHFPAENTGETVFTLRLSEDMKGVDVLRDELTLRTSDEGMIESLSESAPPEWIATLPVLDVRQGETENDIKILTSAETFLLNGFFVTAIDPSMLAGMRVKLSETRSYPTNAGLTVEYQLNTADEMGTISVVPISIRFSIAVLPSELMQPRRSDERVGFFSTVYRDLGDHRVVDPRHRSSDLLDTQIILINKRRMKGSDDPLKYYIDPSVPTEWRQYIKAGVESWQPAFEAVGLGDKAIRGVLPDDDDWPDDYNAGDIRFNSITWAVDTNEIFALGPASMDPRTGEILHSAIVFTNGWISHWESVFELYADPPASSSRRRSLLEAKLNHGHSHTSHRGHHNHNHHSRFDDHVHNVEDHRSSVKERVRVGDAKRDKMGSREGVKGAIHEDHPLLAGGRGGRKHGASGSLRYHGRDECQEARLRDASMSLLPLVAAHHARSRSLADEGSSSGVATNEILGAGLRDVTMHEVGHTLGLRHNFRGSAVLSLGDMQDVSKTANEGLTSSVMDYLPVNIVSSKLQGTEEPLYFTDKVGSYDLWAIKYGYMEVEGEELLEEHEDLTKVASLALPFSTDEDGADPSGMNPFAAVFDLGADPLDYYEDRVELVTELQPVLLDRSTRLGEAFTRYGAATGALLTQVLLAGTYASKFVGGFDLSKQRRVDDSTAGPVQIVSADQQRRALDLILKIVGGEETGGGASFLPIEDDFENMATTGGWCDGLSQNCYAIQPVDVLSKVSSMRKQVLVVLFSVSRVVRVRLQNWADGEASNVLTTTEMFQSTTDAVWGEGGFTSQRAKLWSNWDIMLFWLDVLQAYGSADGSTGVPGDVSAMAAGMVYSIVESGANLTTSDPAYGLYRSAKRKVSSWEIVGTDGFLLSVLTNSFANTELSS